MTFRIIKGLFTTRERMQQCTVSVRFTSDDRGETLSLGAYDTMITVPFEAVKKIIEEERSKR